MFLRYLDATQKSSNVNKDTLHEVLHMGFIYIVHLDTKALDKPKWTICSMCRIVTYLMN